jgi:hypothetical protein
LIKKKVKQVKIYIEDFEFFTQLLYQLNEETGLVDSNPKLFKFIRLYLERNNINETKMKFIPGRTRKKGMIEVYPIE